MAPIRSAEQISGRLASRRNGGADWRQAAVHVASRRQVGRGPRRAGAKASEQGRRTEIAQEAAQEPAARTGRNRDRRPGLVQGGVEGAGLSGPAPARSITRQQPGRELASSSPTTRAEDATLHIPGTGPALRFRPLRDLQHLQSAASPDLPKTMRTFRSAAMVEWNAATCAAA